LDSTLTNPAGGRQLAGAFYILLVVP